MQKRALSLLMSLALVLGGPGTYMAEQEQAIEYAAASGVEQSGTFAEAIGAEQTMEYAEASAAEQAAESAEADASGWAEESADSYAPQSLSGMADTGNEVTDADAKQGNPAADLEDNEILSDASQEDALVSSETDIVDGSADPSGDGLVSEDSGLSETDAPGEAGAEGDDGLDPEGWIEDEDMAQEDPEDLEAVEVDLTDSFVIEDPLVVDPDVAAGAASSGRRMAKRAAAAVNLSSYGAQLDAASKKLYDFRYQHYIANRETGSSKITFTRSDTIYSFTAPDAFQGSAEYLTAFSEIMAICQAAADAFNYDYPEMFWSRSSAFNLTYARTASTSQEGYYDYFVSAINFTPVAAFSGAASYVAQFDQNVITVAEQIRSESDYDLDGAVTENEILQGIHDYIAERCYYDNAGLLQYTSSSNPSDFHIFTAAGVFLDQVGTGIVCEGYARGYKVLSDYFEKHGYPGIHTICVGGPVTGGSLGHMWNNVLYRDNWYLVDVTWDDNANGYDHHLFLTPSDGKRTPKGNITGPTLSQKTSSGAVVTFDAKVFSLPTIANGSYTYTKDDAYSQCLGYITYDCDDVESLKYWEKVAGVTNRHQPSLVTTEAEEATCTTGAYTAGVYCAVCGRAYEGREQIFQPLGHEFAQDGRCTRCGAARLEKGEVNIQAKLVSTGTSLIPEVTVYFGTTLLASGTDYRIDSISQSGAGSAAVQISGLGDYAGSVMQTLQIDPIDLKDYAGKLSGAIRAQTYTGAAITPVPTLSIPISAGQGQSAKSYTLKYSSDFVMSWRNNLNAGTASYTITGTGNFTGTLTGTFRITPVQILTASAASISAQAYSGAALTPKPVLRRGTTLLQEGKDYSLTYSNNINAGTAYFSAKGMGNYTGTLTGSFQINAFPVTELTIGTVSSQAYTGTAITPKPVLRRGGVLLREGTDYSLAYTSNTKVGTAQITVAGKGNYRGTKMLSFQITRRSITGASVQVSDQTYSGKKKTPAPQVRIAGRTLTAGTDYTVTYSKNKAVGTASVKITGKGSYTGTVAASFRINPKKPGLKSVKSAAKKQITVTWKAVSGIGGYQLQYSLQPDFSSCKTLSISRSKTSRVVKGLKRKKTYYVRLRSWQKAGGVRYYSAWSAVKKIKVK